MSLRQTVEGLTDLFHPPLRQKCAVVAFEVLNQTHDPRGLVGRGAVVGSKPIEELNQMRLLQLFAIDLIEGFSNLHALDVPKRL